MFSPKWLIIEPKSPQSLRTIYYVLKFAAKHKAPLNRSAFTYWEEDIPSRIDLGKSKYGGPFTTEQVEDVKTVLRLLAISSPLFLVLMLSSLYTYQPTTFSLNFQHSITFLFTTKLFYCIATFAILTTLVFEFLIYPLAKNKFPSILKRIASVPLILTIVNFVCFILELVNYLTDSYNNAIKWILYTLHFSMNGILFQILSTSLLEFVCAQSPYNMRGLLFSIILPFILLSSTVNVIISDILIYDICLPQPWCPLITFSAKTFISFIGFFLFCVVARWYKMRVRDEDYSPQRVVEEVYDRYLTAAAAQS